MKTLQISAIAFILSVFILSCVSCSTSGKRKPVADNPRFTVGQILLPDYAVPDTMIVVDAIGLNRDIKYAATDQEIACCLYKYCAVQGVELNLLREYQMDANRDGSITFYDGERVVGTIPYDSSSRLSQLIDFDNQ